jgi:glutamate/tyrosine decarboxylase-like PLP-dependent enzyme
MTWGFEEYQELAGITTQLKRIADALEARGQQNAIAEPAIEVIAANPTPAIDPTTPKPAPEQEQEIGNPQCMRCSVMLPCRMMWKETHRKKGRADKPLTIAGFVRFAVTHGADMECLK